MKWRSPKMVLEVAFSHILQRAIYLFVLQYGVWSLGSVLGCCPAVLQCIIGHMSDNVHCAGGRETLHSPH